MDEAVKEAVEENQSSAMLKFYPAQDFIGLQTWYQQAHCAAKYVELVIVL